MRQRGLRLNSPDAAFIFGGPDNEQVYPVTSPDIDEGTLIIGPYDRATAAVDTIFSEENPLFSPLEVLHRRNEIMEDIAKRIPRARKIDRARQAVADAFNEMARGKPIDPQG